MYKRQRVGNLAGSEEIYNKIKNRFSELLTPEYTSGDVLTNTTLGRLHFNAILPSDFPYIEASVRKPQRKKIISEVIETDNEAELGEF